jgi:ubiquinone/menaquinone biosynthesis C-methylase UbiE
MSAAMNRDGRGPRDPRETFSDSAERYLKSRDHGSGPDLELIAGVARQLSPGLTVDVATGAGYALKASAPFSGRCLALDLTLEMLQVTRKHLTGSGVEDLLVAQSSADSLPLGGGVVQLLTCRIAPHHFPSLRSFLEEVRRVLDSEGRAVIIDSVVPDDPECDRFLNGVERQRDPSHVRSCTATEWMNLIDRAGLEVVFFETFRRTHPFQEWARRVGLEDDGVSELEHSFLAAKGKVREQFRIEVVDSKVMSYTDEKGIWILKPAGR